MSTIASNLVTIRTTLNTVTPCPALIAVSKYQPVDALEEAISAGQCDFGENYVQEAADKWPALKQQYPGVRLHLIGSLQRNKLPQALELFDVLHTLDRPALAESLAQARQQGKKLPQCFIQVNTGEEPQKGGIFPADLPAFITLCRDTLRLPVTGLMVIPPAGDNPALHFALLAKLAHRHTLPHLSMGMSDSWQSALKFGSTHVRIGTAIFGERPALGKN